MAHFGDEVRANLIENLNSRIDIIGWINSYAEELEVRRGRWGAAAWGPTLTAGACRRDS